MFFDCRGGLTGDLVLHPEKTAKAASNTKMETAAPIALNTPETVTFERTGTGEQYWYSFTVPEDIGNQWIQITATNHTDRDYLRIALYDDYGRIDYTSNIATLSTDYIKIWPEGSGYNGSISGIFTPGNTYCIKVYDNYSYGHPLGDVTLQALTVPDDNWGTIEKAETLKKGQTIKRELEYSNDVDTYKIKLSKNEHCTFILNGSGSKNIYIYNPLGIKTSSYSTSSGYKVIYWTGDEDNDICYISILGGDSGEYTLTFYKDPKVAKVKGLTSKSKSKEKKKVKWNKIKNAKGYEIYGSSSKNGSYSKLCTVKGNTCTITVLFSSHYYVKVRAYTKKNGITYYGSYSKVKKIK